MIFVRSLLFHTVFFLWTGLWAFALLWVLLLPRRQMVAVITLYFRSISLLERVILGLTYEVRGRENLPEGGCLIACKHQSAYETLKLHLVFGDVAIVLKRELMWIPLWGWYQAKAGMIPVDRGAGGAALTSLIQGAAQPLQDGRRVVIFPQGTRVAVGDKRPYKSGISYLYEKYNVPLVPVALNAGLFWPRHAFLIRPGKVVFDILPPIPEGLPRAEAMRLLEETMEAASNALVPQKTA